MASEQPIPDPDPERQSVDEPRAVLDTLSTAVLVVDGDLRVLDLNPAAEALLELSANAVRGSSLERVWPDATRWSAALARVLRTGQPISERDLTLSGRGGEPITVDSAATPVLEEGQAAWMVVELVPVDRHRRISREEHLLAQSESARQVLRGLAHEVKNPLGGIRGAAQLLERELADPALAEYTQVIVREADRLQVLVDRMLGPRAVPRRRTINVHEVTERVCALIAAESPAGVDVARDYDPSIPELQADPELLIQAVLNVARNAVQALDGRGTILLRTRIHRQLTIGQRSHRLVVSIDVVDDGPGIPDELLEQIFYPMITGRSDGTSLGLSIAQNVVNQHGGLIECESRPGSTTFSVLLPVDNGE